MGPSDVGKCLCCWSKGAARAYVNVALSAGLLASHAVA